MTNSILQIKDVTKIHTSPERTVRALDGVTLDIVEGEILGLLGVNGAGKTTLSSILATLHPPTSGQILYNGKSIYDDVLTYRHIIGMCPQKPNLDQYLNVKNNLLFAGRYFLLPEEQVQQRTKELMDQFDLHKYAEFEIKALSGGWQRRVLIARALMHYPKIIILDEPTVGLDPDVRRNLWDYIKKLKSMGITVILTTHYLDEAEALSDRICMLHKGKVIHMEQLSTLKERHKDMKNLEEIFLHLVAQEENDQ